MVEEEDIASRACNWIYNQQRVGYEQEGYVSACSYFSEAMYRSSAELTCYLCQKYGILIERSHIKGDSVASCATQTDPCSCWDWNNYNDAGDVACGAGDETMTM